MTNSTPITTDLIVSSDPPPTTRRRRSSSTTTRRARANDRMTPLSDALQPWLARRGMPARCVVCGYTGILSDEPYLTAKGNLRHRITYCTCEWGDKARDREAQQRQTMVDDVLKQRADRQDRKLVLPAAYTNYTLETHPLATFNHELHRDILDWVRTWDWRRGLILRGPYGRGKTAYLVAIMQGLKQRAVDEGWEMLYVPGAELFNRLQDGLDDATYARTRDEFGHVHLLAIDDLGASQHITKWRADQYLNIFEARYAGDLPVFATTNLSDAELRSHLTERVYWRLFERCDLFEVEGPNLRDAADVKRWQKGGR